MIYKTLDKEAYLRYHNTLVGKDQKFSKVAMGMWDFMKAWETWPPRVLEDNSEEILSVCFMKLSGQAKSKVLFISNIFTPTPGRGKGSARDILHRNILEAVEAGATSIRLDCNQSALGFYDKLGMTYWGTTISHSMFCDLPINNKGVECFKETQNLSATEILNKYPQELRNAKLKWITKKVKKHDEFDFGHPSRYKEFLTITQSRSIKI